MDAPGARDIFPAAPRLGGDVAALPDRDFGSPSGSLTARSAGREARSGLSCVGGRIGASTAPIFSTASAMPRPAGRPSPRRPARPSPRPRPRPDLVGDRLVGDDLGAVLGELEIEEHAGAAAGLQLAAAAEQLRSRGGGRGGSWSGPGSAPCASGMPGERVADDQEQHRPSSRTISSHQSAKAQLGVPAEDEAGRPSRSSPGAATAPSTRHEQHRQHRIMEADVVIGVGALRRRW